MTRATSPSTSLVFATALVGASQNAHFSCARYEALDCCGTMRNTRSSPGCAGGSAAWSAASGGAALLAGGAAAVGLPPAQPPSSPATRSAAASTAPGYVFL